MIEHHLKKDRHHDYDEILLLIDEKDKDTIAKATKRKEQIFKQKTPNYPRFVAAKQVGYTQTVPLDSELPSHGFNVDYPDDTARRYGFEDLYDRERMEVYLRTNGDRVMLAVSILIVRDSIWIVHRCLSSLSSVSIKAGCDGVPL